MNYKDYIYFDIETAGKYPDLETLKYNDIRGYDLFIRKVERKSDQFKDWKINPNDVYLDKSPLIPEFGRVVCVSMGIIKNDEIILNSIYDFDEKNIIIKVQQIFEKFSSKTSFGLSGFYIKGFDIPWLNRKFLEYGLSIPNLFKNFNIKPWEMNVLDLAEVWKNYGTLENVSLDEMLYLLNIESPKDIMMGKDVHNQFWINKDLDKIKTYCQSDVVSCIRAGEKIIGLL